MSDLNLNTESMKTGSGKLKSLATTFGSCFGRVNDNHQKVNSSVKSDRSGIGKMLIGVFSKTGDATKKMGDQVTRVVEGSGTRIANNAESHESNELKQKKSIESLHPKQPSGGTKPHQTSGGEPSSSGGQSTSTSKYQPPKETPKAQSEDGDHQDLPQGGSPRVNKRPPNAVGENQHPDWQDHKDLPPGKPYKTDSSQVSNRFKDKNDDGTERTESNARDRGRDHSKVDPDGPGVEKDSDGRISKIDGKPVKEYLQGKSKEEAKAYAKPEQHFKDTHGGKAPNNKQKREELLPKEGTCSALAMDLKTGQITHGVNGSGTDVIPPKNMHPLLQQNYQNLRSHEYSNIPKTVDDHSTTPPTRLPNTNKTPADNLQGQAHVSSPAGHAEVKATNELLWKKQAAWDADPANAGKPLPPSAMNDIRVDPRWTSNKKIGQDAPCCANCSTLLDGAGSYTGRHTYDGNDVRRGENDQGGLEAPIP